jgi:cyclase
MSRTLLVRLSAAILVLMGSWAAYTQQGKQANNKLNKLTDDLYAIEGDGGNVALYVTNEGAILVDDKFEYDFNDIMAKVKSVTNQPVKYVMSTHHHGDHTGSNEKLLAGGAEIVAHKNNRMNIIQAKQTGPPRVVFSDEASVFLGGKEIRMRYFGRGHTNGDAMVYFPALRTLHTGDLMAGATPLIDYAGGGSLKEWTATLDAALKLDFDTVIPGHGPVAKKADMLKYRDGIQKFTQRMSTLIRGGKSKDEVAKVLQSEYGWAPDGLQMTRGLDGLMVEMKN